MSIVIEREKALLEKLHETDYEAFDGSKEDALHFVESGLKMFVNYSNQVIAQQIKLPILMYTLDTQDFQRARDNMEFSRIKAHDRCIDVVNSFNRLSERLGLEPFAEVNPNDRYGIADFIGRFVNDVYNDGIGNDQPGREFDNATYVDMGAENRRGEYDANFISEQIAQLNRTFELLQQNGLDDDMCMVDKY